MAPLPADERNSRESGRDDENLLADPPATDGIAPDAAAQPPPEGPRALDGITRFMGLRWEDPETVRLEIRPELINRGGLLSGVVTYAMVDYCMGSTLWAHTTPEERIATITISINYIQTATEGEIVCRTVLDRRNRRIGILRSEIHHDDGRLLVTAIGSYSVFPARGRPPVSPIPEGAHEPR
jgi:acyl-coenzyme A thioesterase PaaI-like protein